MPPITVYTTPACVQCDATVRAFNKQGIPYLEISRWAGWARDGRGAAVSVLILG